MSNDDLDAMLDDALEDFDEQQDSHQKEKEEKAAQLMAEEMDRQRMLQAGAGGADSQDVAMMQTLQTLLGSLQHMDPNAEITEDQMLQMQKALGTTMETLKNGATDEEKEEIARCEKMLTQMQGEDGEPPKDLSPEQLAEMQKHIEALSKQMSSDEMQKLKAEMERCTGAANGNGDGSQPPKATATGADQSARDDDAQDAQQRQAAEAMQEVLQSGVLTDSFVSIKDLYPSFLAEKGPTLPAADRARYEQQYEKITELVDLLKSGALDDLAQIDKFTDLVQSLGDLGAPPPDFQEKLPVPEEFKQKR